MGKNRPSDYSRSLRCRSALLILVAVLLVLAFCLSLSVGAAMVPLGETVRILCGFKSNPRWPQIILNIRLPQALAAVLAGAGLSIAGATMQNVLRNPLCSPLTLGISNAAAFGAALTLMLGGGQLVAVNPAFGELLSRSTIALGAFGGAILATVMILGLSRFHGSRSETIILVGVALSSLFSAGQMFMQYLADEARLAAIVYWTFGDTARASWNSLGLMGCCVVMVSVFFLSQSWNYNASAFGEETAQGLGVPVRRLRTTTMLLASFLTAVIVSQVGIIGFVGLVVPHLARLMIGADNRFLLPFTLLLGGLLLLVADTAARLVLPPRGLPVSILTALIGVPVFLLLLCSKRSEKTFF
ncbi:MAG: iron ABC transporter permease [Planctomycetaceae bacterium]|nr:iron ABC transporter permease [Planctomycetaceae bacterium]